MHPLAYTLDYCTGFLFREVKTEIKLRIYHGKLTHAFSVFFAGLS